MRLRRQPIRVLEDAGFSLVRVYGLRELDGLTGAPANFWNAHPPVLVPCTCCSGMEPAVSGVYEGRCLR